MNIFDLKIKLKEADKTTKVIVCLNVFIAVIIFCYKSTGVYNLHVLCTMILIAIFYWVFTLSWIIGNKDN